MSQVILNQIAKLTPEQANQEIPKMACAISIVNNVAQLCLGSSAIAIICNIVGGMRTYANLTDEKDKKNFQHVIPGIAGSCALFLMTGAFGYYGLQCLSRQVSEIYLPALQKVANQSAN